MHTITNSGNQMRGKRWSFSDWKILCLAWRNFKPILGCTIAQLHRVAFVVSWLVYSGNYFTIATIIAGIQVMHETLSNS